MATSGAASTAYIGSCNRRELLRKFQMNGYSIKRWVNYYKKTWLTSNH